MKFGQVAKLEERLKEVAGRDVRGGAGSKVREAAEGLRILQSQHHTAIFSGPEALKMFLTVRPIDKASNDDPPPQDPTCGGEEEPGALPDQPAADPPTIDPCNLFGMPYYRFYPSSASLIIDDVPLG